MPSGKKVKSFKTKYSLFFSNRSDTPKLEPKPENSVEGIYPSLREFKNSQEDTDLVLRNMDTIMLQKLNNDRDRSDQRSREIEGSLGLALQTIRKLEAEMKEANESKARGEPKKVPIVLMKDNLTKAKRALMAPKQLCSTGANIKAIESKAKLGELDMERNTDQEEQGLLP